MTRFAFCICMIVKLTYFYVFANESDNSTFQIQIDWATFCRKQISNFCLDYAYVDKGTQLLRKCFNSLLKSFYFLEEQGECKLDCDALTLTDHSLSD